MGDIKNKFKTLAQ